QSLQAELAYRADHDALTGLVNRRVFAAAVEAAVAAPKSAGRVAVIFLDLDDFKRVNDSAGHVDADQLLRGVAVRIREGVRPEDVSARLGGDEFAVLMRDVDSPEAAHVAAQRILEQLRAPVAVGTTAYTLKASIGVAVSDSSTHDAVELLRDADVAM